MSRCRPIGGAVSLVGSRPVAGVLERLLVACVGVSGGWSVVVENCLIGVCVRWRGRM
ncbi:MAG: hypothetical protein KY475_27105 [Planctomycetes bacterium]|nr:hypothetical protein [Planctomycetota bacterium]